jgi:hypothetical protein
MNVKTVPTSQHEFHALMDEHLSIQGAEQFCSIWPKARPIIAAMLPLIAFIPNGGAAAQAVLNAVVKMAEQAYADNCAK